MRATLDVTWFLFAVAGWVLMGVTLFHDNWKMSSSFMEKQTNLWSDCVEHYSVKHCLPIGTLLSLPAYIHVCRTLMVVAILLGGVASIGVLALGLKIGRMSEHKVKIAVTGGGLFILSGVCTLIAVSWYASRVVQEFHDPFYRGVKFGLGSGLYVGWAASALTILGGSLLCVSMLCCCCDPTRPPATRPPATRPPAAYNTTHHHVVYRAAPNLYV